MEFLGDGDGRLKMVAGSKQIKRKGNSASVNYIDIDVTFAFHKLNKN